MIKLLIRPLLVAILSMAMVPAGGSGQEGGPQGEAREAAEQYGSPLEQVYGVHSLEALEALTPRDFFARLLAASDPLAIMRRFTPEEDLALLEDRSVEAFLRPARNVMGSIMEGDSVVYAIYDVRHGGQASDYRRLAVLPMAFTGDGWRARPLPGDSELFDPVPFGGPISIRELHCDGTP